MVDREVALEALSVLCGANVTKKQGSQVDVSGAGSSGGAAQQQQLSIKNFIPTVLDADETRQSRSTSDETTAKNLIIDEDEFFDPDHDFTSQKDNETYHFFALKVLNKYEGNAWLGTEFCRTESVPGEWPVSYHVIDEEFYKPGPGHQYDRWIYWTSNINYAMKFTFKKTGKMYEVVLQNRINPEYRDRAEYIDDKYWLVHIGARLSAKDEQKRVGEAIRPYGLLIREV